MEAERDASFLSPSVLKTLKLVEEACGVQISQRGDKLILRGKDADVQQAGSIVQDLRGLAGKGYSFRPDDLKHAINSLAKGTDLSLNDLFASSITVSSKKRPVVPKTPAQLDYINAIKGHDIVVGIGPAGTGKTYLAMAMAINSLLRKQVSRVILTRPAVEAGERLGYLPGDMYEKINPYLRPLYDALYDMMSVSQANRYIEQGTIEIAPLAFMRGRTLNDAFIILDEAQNTTSEQMKMYITRLGYNSKTVLTGDVTQIDLPKNRQSGLVEAQEVLGDIEGIKVVYFSERDVVRHKLVKKIVKAYERYERKKAGRKANA